MEGNAQAASHTELQRIGFSGTGSEYFRIWIVNLALTLLTLGVYSAWAKVRRLKYFYGNTRLAGHAFDYHGRPTAILKGRLIGAAVLITYFLLVEFYPLFSGLVFLAGLLVAPWILTRGRMFQMRMTSYRGVRFDFEDDERGAAKAFLLGPVVAAFTLGLALPAVTRWRYRWLIENTAYGRTFFKLDISLRPYVRAALTMLPVMLAVILLFAGLSTLAVAIVGVPQDASTSPEAAQQAHLAIMLIAYPPMLLLVLAAKALWDRLILNATLSSTRIGPVTLRCQLSARRLAWIYVSNILAIVLTLGLFTPWARVRTARYLLESVDCVATGSMDEFLSAEVERTSAIGEELGELLDVDVGL